MNETRRETVVIAAKTKIEAKILEMLAGGRAVSREEFTREIWDEYADRRSLDVRISAMRKKFGLKITCIQNYGYILENRLTKCQSCDGLGWHPVENLGE